MLSNFYCQKISFLRKHNSYFVDEKYTQRNLDTKVKVFCPEGIFENLKHPFEIEGSFS